MKNKSLLVVSYIVVAMLASICTMFLFSPQSANNKLAALQSLIAERYIGEVDLEEVADTAANAMVEALPDRWSYYISADEYQSYIEQMKNAYVGIGVTIELTADGQGIHILKVTADGPAEVAGICAGDIITHVEGASVAELGLDGVREKIRGREGTDVNLTLSRQGKTMQVTVKRESIQTQVAVGQMLRNGIGYIKIVNFDDRCAQETKAAIAALQAQGAKALIFDVRYNPGGYKHELVNLLDYLLPEKVVFRSEDYMGRVTEDVSNAAYLDMPMAVLVNSESYSAAEFFAAALKDYDAAIIVGEQTSGKGYFQQTYSLPDGSAVALSVGKYYTPKGESLEGIGITPDVVCPVDEDTAYKIYTEALLPEEDPQIQGAVQALFGE